MKTKRRKEDESVGQDSFLDTTANLVGILIILVVIVGAKTRIDAEEYGRKQSEVDLTEGLEEPRAAAQAAFWELEDLKQQQQQYALESEYRQQERDRLLAEVQVAREQIDEGKSSLDEQKRLEFEKGQQLTELQSKLADVQQEIGLAEEIQRPEIVLEHLPTPMARTVFTKEMHVQLKDGKVTVIPWERLVQALRAQVPLAVQRKSNGSGFEDSLGPIGGFVMHYWMNRVSGGYELERFELEQTPTAIAESLDDAFGLGGRLRLELASRNPAETVVTIWVYPNSFAEFRKVKAWMFDEGFLSAARPLPPDVRIGASPQGSRSAAQ